MEPKESLISSGVLVKPDESQKTYKFAPEIENPTPLVVTAASPVTVAGPTTTGTMKKKRGRPRKYGPDGKVSIMASSPMPISALIPLSGPTWTAGRGKPLDSIIKKSRKFEYETTGEKIEYFAGTNFTPHILTVNAGEDVSLKVISFSQQGSRAICILSANGTISNVTLRQPTSCGGTLTYEGCFEILLLSGSYMPTDNGGTKSRTGGMSVSLAGPDGRVVGGGLAGFLVAAGPVQVVMGSFLPGHPQEHKPKKPRLETSPVMITTPTVNVISADELKGSYGGIKPIISPSAFPQDDFRGFRNSVADNKTT